MINSEVSLLGNIALLQNEKLIDNARRLLLCMTSKGGRWRRAYPIAEPYLPGSFILLLSPAQLQLSSSVESPEVELCPPPPFFSPVRFVEFLTEGAQWLIFIAPQEPIL